MTPATPATAAAATGSSTGCASSATGSTTSPRTGSRGSGGTDVLIDRNEIGPVGRQPRLERALGPHPDRQQRQRTADHQQLAARPGLLQRAGGQQRRLHLHPWRLHRLAALPEQPDLKQPGSNRDLRPRDRRDLPLQHHVRRNTWVNGGLAFRASPSFEWDCDSGTGDVVTATSPSTPTVASRWKRLVARAGSLTTSGVAGPG